jgi:hypothetical protein
MAERGTAGFTGTFFAGWDGLAGGPTCFLGMESILSEESLSSLDALLLLELLELLDDNARFLDGRIGFDVFLTAATFFTTRTETSLSLSLTSLLEELFELLEPELLDDKGLFFEEALLPVGALINDLEFELDDSNHSIIMISSSLKICNFYQDSHS